MEARAAQVTPDWPNPTANTGVTEIVPRQVMVTLIRHLTTTSDGTLETTEHTTNRQMQSCSAGDFSSKLINSMLGESKCGEI